MLGLSETELTATKLGQVTRQKRTLTDKMRGVDIKREREKPTRKRGTATPRERETERLC